jgi:hypothetical protein
MPGYIDAVLHNLQHPPPKQPQDAPFKSNRPQYGQKVQLTNQPDDSPRLSQDEAKRIQAITGSLLWYARTVDMTMRVPISAIAAEQSKPTEKPKAATKQLLDYAATHPNVIL